MTSTRNEKMPHFVIVPLVAQGHMIPMVDMACLLAERGVRVSYITTPANVARIKPLVRQENESSISIQFVELPFPSAQYGLPEGVESIEFLSKENGLSFFRAVYSLAEALEHFLGNLDRQPDCIITDMGNPWTGPVARKFGIPRVLYHGPSCFYISSIHSLEINKVYDRTSNMLELVVVPDFPVEVITNKAQTPGFFNNPGLEEIRKKILEEELNVDSMLINTFDELEGQFIEHYENVIRKRVWAIGPMCLCNKSVKMKANRGMEGDVNLSQVLTWLERRNVGSVLYVNFGSLVYVNALQLIELGSGLEASKKPFVWVIKKKEMIPQVKEWLSGGFEERTRDRGLILTGWVPQMVVLSHRAVGGFITHCGWNSILEAICMGVPMITWPYFQDQFVNEKLVVDVLKIGISLGVKMPNYYSDSVLVRKDDVKIKVSALMDEEEGKETRARVESFAKKAKKAMENGGSSYVNITDMIHYFKELKAQKNEERNGV
ncbi:hypothetical protein LUZ60_017771 [Juncus effusus]|nr:hypothetical protein LUZ60_017771 [Juncus effusus]